MFASADPGRGYLGQAHPSHTYWGVDSATRANAATDTPGKDFFELVKAQAGGTAPKFWGRYIGSGFNLTKPEALHLHNNNCRILLIYNGHTVEGALVTTKAHGEAAATNAMTAARNLGVPEDKTVWIYCDIEPEQSPTDQFFIGWFEKMRMSSGYGGGVYGLPGRSTFSEAYCGAWAPRTLPELLYSGLPLPVPATCKIDYRVFNPARPAPCNPPAVVHQYSIGLPGAQGCPVDGALPGQKIDLDLANDWGFPRMWAPRQRWRLGAKVVGELADMTTFAAVRAIDVTDGGRIYLAWGDPNLAQHRIAYSDDSGAHWTVPMGVAWLAETLFTVCALDDESLVIITRQGVGSGARFLYHYRWLNNAWSGGALVRSVSSPNTISPPRAAHSRPDTAYSVFWREGNINASNNILYWAPITTTGIGTAEAVDGDGTNRTIQQIISYALYYNESHEPVALWVDTTATPQGKKRVRSGGVWGAVTQFDGLDQTLLDSMILQEADSEYSTGLRSNGDVHALRPQGTTFVFDYRHRISGSWADEVVDLSELITGSADSSSRHRSSVPILLGSRVMIAVYTVGSTQFALWFAYRDL